MTKVNLKNILTVVRDMIMRNRVAYKDYLGTDENGNKIYDTKLIPVELLPNIPSKLLPKTLATKREVQAVKITADDALSTATNAHSTATNAHSTATNAQSTATNAQSTATNAQSTANDAKTAAENAQSTANAAKFWSNGNITYQAIAATVTLDSGIHYKSLPGGYHLIVGEEYKSDVLSFGSETWDGERMMFSNPTSNITIYWDAKRMEYMVSSPILREVTFSGLFLPQPDIAKGKFMVLPPYAVAKNVVLNSSTPGSTKQFFVTVDDTGTLSATEVTE